MSRLIAIGTTAKMIATTSASSTGPKVVSTAPPSSRQRLPAHADSGALSALEAAGTLPTKVYHVALRAPSARQAGGGLALTGRRAPGCIVPGRGRPASRLTALPPQ